MGIASALDRFRSRPACWTCVVAGIAVPALGSLVIVLGNRDHDPLVHGGPGIVELRESHRTVLPGEFEPQAALLLAFKTGETETSRLHRQVLTRIAAAVWHRIRIVCLVADHEAESSLQLELERADVVVETVTFVRLPVDSIWIRDYGPFAVRHPDGRCTWLATDYWPIDAAYWPATRIADASRPRPLDNLIARQLAETLVVQIADLSFDLPGGNILSNGDGVLVTTTRLLENNAGLLGVEPPSVVDRLGSCLGGRSVVVLEPLHDEPTHHVDTFVTFPASDTVVIGQFDRKEDFENSRILDRNARLLARVRTKFGPLKVERIPMPRRVHGTWGGSFTNVVYANGILLVPRMHGNDDRLKEAIRVYRRILPGWEIKTIEASEISRRGGALHCVTKTLWRFPTTSPGRSRFVSSIRHPNIEAPIGSSFDQSTSNE